MKRRKRSVANDAPARMVGYCRVSTEEQAREGVSMDAQRERLAAYCTAQGYTLVGIESDNGTSGGVAPHKRAGLARAMSLIQDGEADGLLALKLDRLSRSTRDVLDLVDDSRREGWRLVSVSEQLDTGTAAGRMVLTVLAALSEMEREQVGERTRFALEEVARQGRARSRFTPFGYATPDGAVQLTKGCRAALVENPTEFPTLQRMQSLRTAGKGSTAIAKALNREGFTNRRGTPWSQQAVWSVLAARDKRQSAEGTGI